MGYQSAEILDFREYVFNDTGHTARHFGLVILPAHLTAFQSSLYCAVITSRKPGNMWSVHEIDQADYSCFDRPTFIRIRDLDYVPLAGLDATKKQPVGSLNESDCKKVRKHLYAVMFSPKSPVDKFLRGAIIREWKKTLAKVS